MNNQTVKEPCYMVSNYPYIGGSGLIPTKTIDIISHVNGRIIESLPNTPNNKKLLSKKYPQIGDYYYE